MLVSLALSCCVVLLFVVTSVVGGGVVENISHLAPVAQSLRMAFLFLGFQSKALTVSQWSKWDVALSY